MYLMNVSKEIGQNWSQRYLKSGQNKNNPDGPLSALFWANLRDYSRERHLLVQNRTAADLSNFQHSCSHLGEIFWWEKKFATFSAGLLVCVNFCNFSSSQDRIWREIMILWVVDWQFRISCSMIYQNSYFIGCSALSKS